jgi:hypothetical protein
MTLVLSQSAGDPSASNVSESNIPLRSKRPLGEAMKALDTPDYREAASRLQAAVAASPKFVQVWHTLGVVDERPQNSPRRGKRMSVPWKPSPNCFPLT